MFSTTLPIYPPNPPPVPAALSSGTGVTDQPPAAVGGIDTSPLPGLLADASQAAQETHAAADRPPAFALPDPVPASKPSQASRFADRAGSTAKTVRDELLPCVVNQEGLTSCAAIRAYAHHRSDRTSAEVRSVQFVTPAGVERMVASGAGRCHENAALGLVRAMIDGLVPPGATAHRVASGFMDHAYACIDYPDGSSVVLDPWLQTPFGGSLNAYPHRHPGDESLFVIHHHADATNLATISATRLGLEPTTTSWAGLCNAYQAAIERGLQARSGDPVWKAVTEGPAGTPEQNAATLAEFDIYAL